jgi:hypothetical protein
VRSTQKIKIDLSIAFINRKLDYFRFFKLQVKIIYGVGKGEAGYHQKNYCRNEKQNIIEEMYILSRFKALYAYIITNSSCHVEGNSPKIILKMPGNEKYPQSNDLDPISYPEKSLV